MLTSTELVWLLAATAKGDEAAFERLYGATGAKLYGIVRRILRRADLAGEAMQEAYVTIWNGAGGFDPALSAPVGWMVAIARACAIDLLRRQTEVAAEEEAEEAAPAAPVRQPMNDELRRLLACMGRLDEDRRRLLLSAYYSGSTRQQLADQFGVPADSVKAWLARALAELRECLA